MVRNAFLLILVCCLFASVLRARPQAASESREQDVMREILELERQSKEAAIRRDAAFSERVLADDYLAIGPLGQIITKAESVAARKRPQVRYDSIDLSEMVVRVYNNTAVVTARAEVKGKDVSEDFSGPYRFTRVWVKRNGQWQTVSYQATVTR